MLQVRSLVQPAGVRGDDRVAHKSASNRDLLVVCDGAGGVGGSGDAADIVTQHFMAYFPLDGLVSLRAVLVTAIEWLDRSAMLPASGGLTTVLVVMVSDGMIEGASVGDSEAWLMSDDDVVELTERQSRRPLVGSRRCTPSAFGPTPLDGTLVLGTDGLFKYCPRNTLLSIARGPNLDEIPQRLLEASALPNGRLQDDFGVVVCRRSARVHRGIEGCSIGGSRS